MLIWSHPRAALLSLAHMWLRWRSSIQSSSPAHTFSLSAPSICWAEPKRSTDQENAGIRNLCVPPSLVATGITERASGIQDGLEKKSSRQVRRKPLAVPPENIIQPLNTCTDG